MKKTFRLTYSIVQDGFLDFASQSQMKEALTQLEEGDSSIDDASNSAHWMSKAVTYHKRYDSAEEFETSVITEINHEPLKEYS
ncbi:MAG: hypothetical protein CBC38_00075 [Gammaproteobacteria bacterium TMED78]|nr:MAG: hypothetical protein CBC38_00075 [Gammaproteobacteria bacterium TMED78]|tara:strand:+ start:3963 stop:4211 length:249 start_codon:yes stop_codon:yes gene_type:complete